MNCSFHPRGTVYRGFIVVVVESGDVKLKFDEDSQNKHLHKFVYLKTIAQNPYIHAATETSLTQPTINLLIVQIQDAVRRDREKR